MSIQEGIAKLILNGYGDRLLLLLLLFVPSSDISLGIAMASVDWAGPSVLPHGYITRDQRSDLPRGLRRAPPPQSQTASIASAYASRRNCARALDDTLRQDHPEASSAISRDDALGTTDGVCLLAP